MRNRVIQLKRSWDRLTIMFTYDDDPNIYINGNLKLWGYEETKHTPDHFVTIISAALSHETIHIVLDNIGERKASWDFDNIAGGAYDGDKWVNGLYGFEYNEFKPTPKSRRLKGW